MHSRAEYVHGLVPHRQYFAQFVTPDLKRRIAQTFKPETLHKAVQNDEHLNNIRIGRWDELTVLVPTDREHITSLADKVCVLKEAAKQVAEEWEDARRQSHQE